MQQPPEESRWNVRVDVRDVVAVVGVGIAAVGAWVVHPGLALVALGAGLTGAAVWLAKRH